MSTVTENVSVELIKDAKSVSLEEAMRIAISTEVAQRKVDDAGLSISEVLYNQMVKIRDEVVQMATDAGKEYNGVAAKLRFEESLLKAEELCRENSDMAGKLPRCWTNAKSHLGKFLKLGGNPHKYPTVSAIKKWNSQETKRLEEEEARQDLQSYAAKGEHVKDTGAAGGQKNTSVSESKTIDSSSPVFDSTSDLTDEVYNLIQEVIELARQCPQDKALKMIGGLKKQLDDSVKSAISRKAG